MFKENLVVSDNIMIDFIDRHKYRNLGFKGNMQAPLTLSRPGVYILSDGENTYVGKSMNVTERLNNHNHKLRFAIIIQASYNNVNFTSGVISSIEAFLISSLTEKNEIKMINKVIEIELHTNYEVSIGISVLRELSTVLKNLKKDKLSLFNDYVKIFPVLPVLKNNNYLEYQTDESNVYNKLDDYILKNYVFNKQGLLLNTERKFLNAAKHLTKDVNYHLVEVDSIMKQTHGIKHVPYLIFIDATKVDNVAYEALALTVMHDSDVKVINIMKNDKSPYVTDISYYDDGADNVVEVLNYNFKRGNFIDKCEANSKIDFVITKHKDPYEECIHKFTYKEKEIYINTNIRC